MRDQTAVLNLRTSEHQAGYAWSITRETGWQYIDLSVAFLHADRSNLGVLQCFRSIRSLFQALRLLPDFFNALKLVRANFPTICEAYYGATDSEIRVNGYLFYLQGMRSTLAKRLKITIWQQSPLEKKYLWMMCFDTVMAHVVIKKYELYKYSKICIFNGRVIPEFIFRKELESTLFFEFGGPNSTYLGELPPVSLARFTAEFPSLGPSQLVSVVAPLETATIFLTSDYEYTFAGDGYSPEEECFQSQAAAIIAAIKVLDERGIATKIKAHPGAGPEQAVFLSELADTYPFLQITTKPALELISASSVVVVSSSSVAVEAAAAGKPVIHMMPAYYQNLGVSIYIRNTNELENFFASPHRHAGQRKNASQILASPLFASIPSPKKGLTEKILLKLKSKIWCLK